MFWFLLSTKNWYQKGHVPMCICHHLVPYQHPLFISLHIKPYSYFFLLPINIWTYSCNLKKKFSIKTYFFFILFYIFSFQNTLYHIIYFTLYFIKITNFIDFLKLFFLIYIYNIYNNRWSREKIQLDFNWILNFAPFVLTKTQKKNLIRL